MHLIGRRVLESFKMRHADARGPLERWERLVAINEWRNFAEMRITVPSADQVKLDRELVVTVFNVGGNKYRLISEVVYSLQVVRALLILPHAQYDKGRWKGALTR